MSESRILIIAPQSLERFIPSLGAAASIRAYHREAEIVLLCPPKMESFASSSPYFDRVWVDTIRGIWDVVGIWRLRKMLRAQSFERVYDLGASSSSYLVFWLLYGLDGLPLRRRRLPWSGTIKGTALSPKHKHWNAMHTNDRWAAQLSAAGIPGMIRADLSWVARQVRAFSIPFRMDESFVILAMDPGPGTHWPLERYTELARELAESGLTPVLAGFGASAELAARVARNCPGAVNLVNAISLEDLVFLSWAACAAVGTDNGTLHLTATASCHTVVLYDSASDPALVGQRGESVVILRRGALREINPNEVLSAIRKSSKIGGN